MKTEATMRRLRALLALALLCCAGQSQASPLLDGTNADLWLIETQSGEVQVTGYNFNAWLDQFAPGGTPLYPLVGNQQALINVLQNSSLPMSPSQPSLSVVGLDPGLDGGNPLGHPNLLVQPDSGSYEETIAVRIMVSTRLLSLDPVRLAWTVDGGATEEAFLTKDVLQQPGTVVLDGYVVRTVHLAREGNHTVNAELYVPQVPPLLPRLVGSETRNYSLASSHPEGEARDVDGDGIPDVVEAEIGLDPYDDDWQKDSDGDGWSDFDEWLRTLCLDASLQPQPGTDCTDAEGNPQDTDGDGWADFDEQVRGTNHLDTPINPARLLEEDETLTSVSLLDRIRGYKDFPAARRLYETERLAAGNLPSPASELLPPDSVAAVTVFGEESYDSNGLLTDDDISRAGLLTADIAPRKRAADAAANIASALLPSMRLPAGDGSVIAATYRSTAPGMTFSRIYKRWLTQHSDLSPLDFRTQTGPQTYADAEAWRSDFVAYLVANTVVQDPAIVVDTAGTAIVSMLEAALGRESRLNNLQPTQLLSPDFGAIDPNLVRLAHDGLVQIAGADYLFDDVIASYTAASQAGQVLEPVAQWITAMFQSGADGSRSDAYIAAAFETGVANDYLVRLLALPGAGPAVAGDATLADRNADSDADTLSNNAELDVPLANVTLPWLADTDGDTIPDSSDECPNDPFNDCGPTPILPTVTVGFDVVVSEPEAGSNVAIISIILDRIVDFDVTIDFRAYVATGDTAEGGTDFTEVTGTVTIPAGERVALIAVPVFADADNEAPETFTVEITGVTGAVLGDDGVVVVTINNTTPGANTPPVFTSLASINAVEGNTATGYTATATDDDGDNLTFGISGGADQAAFSIDPASGDLSFVQAPDFDVPTDADANNDYEVQLSVDDGRGGSDALDVTVTVVEAGLTVAVTFPTVKANLGGGVAVTTVTGNIVDPAGAPINPADINFVDVNGNVATFDAGNPARWSVQVPVSAGPNTLDITFERADGSSVNLQQELQNFGVHLGFGDSEPDFANNRMLVVDGFIDGIVAVDLASGDRTTISGVGTGTGTNFSSPRGVVLDSANNRAIVTDWQLDAVIAADLATGDRTIISNASNGTGIGLDGLNALVLDAANNRVFVGNAIDNMVVAVDLATGDRTTITGDGTGAGIDIQNIQGMEYDAAGNRVFVSDSQVNGIISVDVTTGDRVELSGDTVGAGPAMSSPLDMALDSAGNRILIADQTRGLFAIDLASGDRTQLDDLRPEYGLNGSRLQSVVYDATTNTAYVPDSRPDAIFAMDLDTGTRTILSDSFVGSGPPDTGMWGGQGIALDRGGNRLLLSNTEFDNVYGVDLATADRSVLSDSNNAGPPMSWPRRMFVDADNNRVIAAEANLKGVIAIDLDTGDRTAISDNSGTGTGPAYANPIDVAIDLANDRVLLLDQSLGLIDIVLSTGDRTILSDSVTGSGPMWAFADGLEVDFVAGVGYIVDDGGTAVYSVDIATGDRTIVSDNAGTGTGPNISFPHDLQLDVANNRALIINRGGVNRNLMAVDLASGDRTILSDNNIGSGVPLQSPYHIELDADNDRVFINDIAVTGVIVINLSTGERALASK